MTKKTEIEQQQFIEKFLKTELAACLAATQSASTPTGELAIRGIVSQPFEFAGERHERFDLVQFTFSPIKLDDE